jgi:peptidoglycan/LPS O-acetylase OafA/YrhL
VAGKASEKCVHTGPNRVPVEGRYYRPELDVLRFFAFFLVFLSHTVPGDAPYWVVGLAAGGAFGVDLFFALSSFLITTLLLRERDAGGTIDVPAFYMRRILRIWPLYFVFLLVITPVMSHVLADESLPLKYTAAFLLLAGNWACVFWGYPHSIAGPLWSVSMEEQFYLVWPWVMRRWAANLVVVALMLLAVSFAVRIYLVMDGAVHPQIWCNTLARLDPIAGGAILAVIVKRRETALSGLARAALFVFAIVALAIAGRYGDFTGARSLITFPAVAAVCIALVLATLGMPAPRPLVYLGRISYGLYVFHLMFVMLFDVTNTHDPVDRVIRIVLTLLATIAAAALSYHLFERRFLRWKERFAHVQSRPA